MKSLEEWGRDLDERPIPTTFKLGAVFAAFTVVLLIVISLISTGSVFFQAGKAKTTIGARVQQKVYQPDNATAQIAFFHDTCQAVNRSLIVVKNAQQRLTTDQHNALSSRDFIQQRQAEDSLMNDTTDVTGAQNILAGVVTDYNSRSAQSIANVFKGTGLPDRITIPNPIPADYQIDCG